MKIPELFLWHRKDFISGHDLAEIAVESDGLVAFIASHLSGDMEHDLNELMKVKDKGEKTTRVVEIFNNEIPLIQSAFKLIKSSENISVDLSRPNNMCIYTLKSLFHKTFVFLTVEASSTCKMYMC